MMAVLKRERDSESDERNQHWNSFKNCVCVCMFFFILVGWFNLAQSHFENSILVVDSYFYYYNTKKNPLGTKFSLIYHKRFVFVGFFFWWIENENFSFSIHVVLSYTHTQTPLLYWTFGDSHHHHHHDGLCVCMP